MAAAWDAPVTHTSLRGQGQFTLPTDSLLRILHNTPLYSGKRNICLPGRRPMGWFLTIMRIAQLQQTALKAWRDIFREIENLGGVWRRLSKPEYWKCVMKKLRLACSGRIDSGAQIIVGANKYRLEKGIPIDNIEVNHVNTAVRLEQVKIWSVWKKAQINESRQSFGGKYQILMKTGKGNLTRLAVRTSYPVLPWAEFPDACEGFQLWDVINWYQNYIDVYSSAKVKIHELRTKTCELTKICKEGEPWSRVSWKLPRMGPGRTRQMVQK